MEKNVPLAVDVNQRIVDRTSGIAALSIFCA